ncbi:hypothetical protein ACIQ34_00775 [Ureibacillus sp. NPDC094379]
MKIKKQYFYVFIFLPIFFTTSGLYKSYVTETYLHLGDTGLVLPIYFLVSIFFLILILLNLFRFHRLKFEDLKIKKFALAIIVMGLILAGLGFILSANSSGFIRIGQIITGLGGVIIAYYLFEIKKINIEKFFGLLGILYFVIIILNYMYSISLVGLASFGRALQPSWGLFDIFQTHVYYPFIVNAICFMSIPFLLAKYGRWIYPYLGLYFIYLLNWQVRGAIISFIFMLIVTIFLKLNINKKFEVILFFITFISILIMFIDVEELVGRFANVEGVKNLSGRTDIWSNVFENFNMIDFLVGSLFLDLDGVTAHNQYLEFFDLGGILYLSILILLLLNIIKAFFSSYILFGIRDNLTFYLIIILVQVIIDFNVNVPMSNTNPAIFYWFYISSIFILFNRKINKLKGIQKI